MGEIFRRASEATIFQQLRPHWSKLLERSLLVDVLLQPVQFRANLDQTNTKRRRFNGGGRMQGQAIGHGFGGGQGRTDLPKPLLPFTKQRI